MGSIRIAALCAWLMPLYASGQLATWLVRDLTGVRLVDMSVANPVVGPLIPGLGTSGLEDVNVMTDAQNNLLFCSAVNAQNEIKVFNANLTQMPNGGGLLGHTSTSHSVISPAPCYSDRYFLVHLVTANSGQTGELYYSTVDMSLNGGLGDVVNKNTFIANNMNEGLAISRMLPTGCRWLFGSMRNGNSYDLVRCLISHAGVGPPEVIASVSIGQSVHYNDLELDPANTRLAMSMYNAGAAADIVIWDLDLASGTVSGLQTYAVSNDPIIGLQFSPTGQYLYYLGNSESSSTDFGRLHLATGTPELITPNMGSHLVHLELAANGRIYAGKNAAFQYIAVVAFPDAPQLSSIGFSPNGIFVSNQGLRPGLPSAIEGEPPGTTATPAYIDFSAHPIGDCVTYQFVDSTCLSTWWEWDLGDGTISHEQAPIHTFGTGTYDITLRVVACGDTLSLTRPAYITAATEAPVAAFVGPDTLCAGAAADFLDQSLLAAEVFWDLGDGTTSQDTALSHVYTEPGTYTVQLVAVGPCLNDTITSQVTVLPTADASFTALADPCDLQVVFIADGPGEASLNWDLGDGTTSQQPWMIHTYTVSGTYDVTLVASLNGMCPDTVTMSIAVGGGVDADPVVTVGCGGHVVFQDTGQQGDSWTWSLGDGTVLQTDSGSHVYDAPGTYEVLLTVSDEAGCSGSFLLPVLVPPFPFAQFEAHLDPCSLSHVFRNMSANAVSHAWDFGDGSTSAAFEPAHQYPDDGTYTVWLVVTGVDGCVDSTSQQMVVSHIDDRTDGIIPNCFTPNGDGVNDRFEIGLPQGCAMGMVRIYNRWGQMVFESDRLAPWDGTVEGSAVPEGVYMYVVEYGGQHFTGHVSLMR